MGPSYGLPGQPPPNPQRGSLLHADMGSRFDAYLQFRVVTMDVRGFGETSARWTDYSARSVGLDAISIVRRLGAGPATITGNSFAAGSAL